MECVGRVIGKGANEGGQSEQRDCEAPPSCMQIELAWIRASDRRTSHTQLSRSAPSALCLVMTRARERRTGRPALSFDACLVDDTHALCARNHPRRAGDSELTRRI